MDFEGFLIIVLLYVFSRTQRGALLRYLRNEPPQVGKVLVNTPLIAVEDSGDWMRVLLVPLGASPDDIEELWAKHVSTAEGEREKEEETLWALRQQGDMIYLVSCTFYGCVSAQ